MTATQKQIFNWLARCGCINIREKLNGDVTFSYDGVQNCETWGTLIQSYLNDCDNFYTIQGQIIEKVEA